MHNLTFIKGYQGWRRGRSSIVCSLFSSLQAGAGVGRQRAVRSPVLVLALRDSVRRDSRRRRRCGGVGRRGRRRGDAGGVHSTSASCAPAAQRARDARLHLQPGLQHAAARRRHRLQQTAAAGRRRRTTHLTRRCHSTRSTALTDWKILFTRAGTD